MRRGIKTIISGKQNIHKAAYGKIANAVGLGANGRIRKISPYIKTIDKRKEYTPVQ